MIKNSLLPPENCKTITDIRRQIDAIDEDIIKALGIRFQYVKEIVRFKKDKESVKAPKRYHAVLDRRREWAAENGLDPDIIEQMYKHLIHHFIEVEKKIIEEKNTH